MIASEMKTSYGAKVSATIVRAMPVISTKVMVLALGLSIRQRFIYITTPIAIRLAIPAYSNDIVSLMKSTALASTITLVDMTGIARTIVAETFAPYEVFISLAIIYMIMTLFIQKAFGRFERYMSRYLVKES